MSAQEELDALYGQRRSLEARLDIATQRQIASDKAVADAAARFQEQNPAAPATYASVGPQPGEPTVTYVDQQTMADAYERATPQPESPAALQAQIDALDGRIADAEQRQAMESGFTSREAAARDEQMQRGSDALGEWKEHHDTTTASVGTPSQDQPPVNPAEMATADVTGAIGAAVVGKAVYDRYKDDVKEVADKAAEFVQDAKEYAKEAYDKVKDSAKEAYEWATDKEGKDRAAMVDRHSSEMQEMSERHDKELTDMKAEGAEMAAKYREIHKDDPEGKKAVDDAKQRDAQAARIESKVAEQTQEHLAQVQQHAAEVRAFDEHSTPPPPPPPQQDRDQR